MNIIDYFDRKKSTSTNKNHDRFRNDIVNHWDLDYMSYEQLEQVLTENRDIETTKVRRIRR
tara:strand:+ start:446 stop:628 length:183 start_codon:yes stop_codon:yes gene_type:complete